MNFFQVETQILNQPRASYPMWIIIASSAIGVTLISILFIVCYRVGWFDRQDHHSKSTFYRGTKLDWIIK